VRISDCDEGLARFVVWIRDGKPNHRATDDARELERIDDERECVARDSGAIDLLGTSLDALMISATQQLSLNVPTTVESRGFN